jgi:LEA14-like dessication related protein
MKRKITVYRGFCAALLTASLFVFSTCQSLPNLISEPVVSFKGVTLTGISFDGADLTAVLNVENTNPFSIPVPEIDWELFIKDSSFLSGTIKSGDFSAKAAGVSGGKLAASSVTPVSIPFHVPYKGLYTAISTLLSANEAPYRVSVGVRFSLPVIREKTFKAEFSGVIPMLKVPALSFRGVKFNSLSLQKVEFVLTWAVENKNAFAIDLDTLGYSFSVNNSQWAKGAAPRRYSLAAGKTTEVPVTVTINSFSMITEIVGLAATGREVSYTCAGEAALRPDFPGLKVLSLPYNQTGSFNLRR